MSKFVYCLALAGSSVGLLSAVCAHAAEEVEEVIVLGTYRSMESRTLGLPTSVLETPRALQVVMAENWEARNITHPNEALRLTSGFAQSGTYGGFRPAFSLRSFSVSRILDDGFNVIGSSGARTSELAAFSRIEALKGPAGTEYGNISSGGIVNFVSRMPLDQDALRLTAQTDSYGQRRGVIDANAAAVGGGVGLRGVVAYENSDSFRDHVNKESVFFSPSLSWRLGDATRVNAVLRYQEATGTFDQGLPSSPLVLDLPVTRFLNEPTDEADFQTTLARVWLEHQISEAMSLRLGANKSHTTYDNMFWSPRGNVNEAARTFSQGAVTERNTIDEEILQAQLIGRYTFVPDLRSEFLAGIEWQKEQVRPMSQTGSVLTQNSLDVPVYGRPFQPVADVFRLEKQKWVAVTLQQQQTWREKLTFSAGLRADFSDVSRLDENNGLYRELDNSEVSPFVGLSYRPIDFLSLYANYATSYTNQIGVQLENNGMPDPLLGKQFEIGAKAGTDRLEGTFSVFEITQRNVLTASETTPGVSVQTGEVRTRGVELEFSTRLLDNWTVQSAYTYLDAEVTKDNVKPVGSKMKGDSRHNLNVWTQYELSMFADGLSVGAGAFYVGERDGGNAGPLSAYTRYDASLSYDVARWQATLYLENISDVKYHYRRGPVLAPQTPFTVSARLAMRF